MGERAEGNIDLTYLVWNNAVKIYNPLIRKSQPKYLEAFTQPFSDTPNFDLVYKGNLNSLEGRSVLGVDFWDPRYDVKSPDKLLKSIIKRYLNPQAVDLSQFTQYSEDRLSIIRLLMINDLYGIDQYQVYYPNVKIKDNAPKLDRPEYITELTDNDLVLWKRLLEDEIKFHKLDKRVPGPIFL
jgi:hypothetical protein